MRGLRSTLALLAVLIGLGAYIYFVASKKTDETAAEKLFAPVEASAIAELKVKSESGDVTTLKKVDGAWRIVAPVDTGAGDTEATGIANALADMDVVRVVEETPADVKEYGLETPRIEVDFKSADGKSQGRLLVGEKTATGGSLYARRDDQKRVVLIGQYHEGTLNKTTFDLRDKAVIKFDRTQVESMNVDVGGKTIEFKKSGGEWTMVSPRAARADFSAVDGLVGRLESLQMKSIVSNPGAADLRRFGLERPQATVNLRLGSANASLAIGGQSDETTIYVRDGSRPDVFTTDATIVDDVKRPVDEYRKKELFDARAFNVTRAEITRDGQTTAFERVKATTADAPDTWRRVSPNPGDPPREKVESFVASLANIRATSFLESPAGTGLDSPALTIVVKFDEGRQEERVTFGRKGSDVFAARPDDPGAARIDAAQFDESVKTLDEISK